MVAVSQKFFEFRRGRQVGDPYRACAIHEMLAKNATLREAKSLPYGVRWKTQASATNGVHPLCDSLSAACGGCSLA